MTKDTNQKTVITSTKTIKALVKHGGLKFNKDLGQNFLVNSSVAETMVSSAEVSGEDTVVEPGAGIGALTFHIANRAKKVLAIEIDENTSNVLVELANGLEYENVEIVNQDIMSFDADKKGLASFGYKVVGSLPYDLAKKIIRKFLEQETAKPSTMVVMVQKEVAKEYVAKPPNTTFLSQYVKIFADVKYVQTVTKQAFYPIPPVDGGILQFKLHKKPTVSDPEGYRRFLKVVYSARRRTVINTINKQLRVEKHIIEQVFKKIGINFLARPQELENWPEIYSEISAITDISV